MAIKLRYKVTCICGGYFGGFTRDEQYRHSNCCSCAGEIDPIEGKRFRKSNSPEKLLKELGKDEEWLASMGMKLTQ